MKLSIILSVIIALSPVFGKPVQDYFLSSVASASQEKAVRALILRTIGKEAAAKFTIGVDTLMTPKSYKILKSSDHSISIVGSDGVSVAKGFHHYLKYYLGKDITWRDTQVNLTANDELPKANLYSVSASSVIYYQNVCTWSYSFAWWSWSLWRRHIDWMAMMGISFTLAPVQEYVWHEVYLSMGLNESEIAEHFAGPAFQAWQRMGNLRAWAGPVPPKQRKMQKTLQKQIIKAQRSLGMVVALPAFAGHVPTAMARLYPNTSFTHADRWCRFADIYCCPLFIDPSEPLFRSIGVKFLQKIVATYGSNHIYFCDPFNEMQPPSTQPVYMQRTAKHIYAAMQEADSEAIWLLQGWMFLKNIFWSDEIIGAFLTAVPQGRMLVLDLMSDQYPQYERTHSYHGQPFIWCMLHNFGGTLGMHGAAEVVNTRIRLARNMSNSTMVGVGITPEGINQNYVMYALALERAWMQDDFDLEQWFNSYADAQYGVKDAQLRTAWQHLRQSVYSYYGLEVLHGKYAITRRPSLTLKASTWYNETHVLEAWRLFLAANATVPGHSYHNYRHDLVDLTRQFLQDMWNRLYVKLIAAFKKRQLLQFTDAAKKLLELLTDMEHILATNTHFMLGPWLESAKSVTRYPAQKLLYEMNARNQITVWGPSGQILDYATKQWSGIVRDYYHPRWALFLQMAAQNLKDNTKFNKTAYNRIVSEDIENPFSVALNQYPTHETGQSYEIAKGIYDKWTLFIRNHLID